MLFKYTSTQGISFAFLSEKIGRVPVFPTEMQAYFYTLQTQRTETKTSIGTIYIEGNSYTVLAWFESTTEQVNIELIPQISLISSPSEVLFKRMLDTMTIQVAILRPDRTYFYLNPASVQNESTRNWLIGKKDEDYFQLKGLDTQLVEERKKQFFQCIETQKAVVREEKIVNNNGETYHYIRILHPLFDADGEIQYIIGYTHPITELKNTEEVLSKTSERYQRIFQECALPMWIIDWETLRFIDVNNRATEIYGYTKEEFLEDIHITHLRQDTEGVLSYIQNKISNKEMVYHGETTHYKKDGTPIEVEFHGILFYYEDKIYSISTILDITEKKQNQVQIEQTIQDLKKLNAELDRFVYSASHDLRAPLLSILGLIDLTESTLSGHEHASYYFGLMRKSITQMDDTIKGILEYSKNARVELLPELIEVEPMVTQQIEDILFLERSKNIHFIMEIENYEPFWTDKNRFKALLSNLITNAVKYSRTSNTPSFVKTSFHTCENQGILIIEDNGEGIPTDKQSKVFDMFYRNSVKTTGSGLGLYICKEIVQRLGGSITLQSQKGVGSTFSITIPNLNPSFQRPIPLAEV